MLQLSATSTGSGGADDDSRPSSQTKSSSKQSVKSSAGEVPTMGQMADAIQASSRLAARTSRSHSYDHASNSGFDMGDDDTAIDSSTDEICVPGSEHTGRWTRKEHELFLDALKKYGKETMQ